MSRKRIGLALSGGGARGAAHVGVLRVLEELHIPIDVIAGTSMGAVVGGMYCAGMAPETIQNKLDNIDWKLLLKDNPPRKEMPIHSKGDEGTHLFGQEVGFQDGAVVAPGGLVAGQNLGIVLEGLTSRVLDVDDFDRFTPRFRAVATDIGTAEKVVIGNGRLPDAIRASMSIPGAFAPVSRDRRLLVDGGLVDNLPVDVAFAMGADIVIAVDIGTPYLQPSEVTNMVKIFEQTLQILTRKNTEENLAKASLVIRPDLKKFTGNDYQDSARIVALGEEEARRMSGVLSRYSIPDEDYAAYRAARQREPYQLGEIGFVKYEEEEKEPGRHVDQRTVLGRIESQPGGTLDIHTLQEDLGRIYSMGEFERVTFTVQEEEGRQGLVIRTKEKPWGPDYLRFGLKLQSDFEGGNFFSLSGKLTVARLNALGAEWKTTAEFGWPSRVYSELYQPLTFSGRVFAAPVVDLNWVPQYYFEGTVREAEYEVRSYLAGADIGAAFGAYGEFRLGARWGARSTDTLTGQLPVPDADDHVAALVGQLLVDQLDSGSFPREGYSVRIQAFMAESELGSDLSYHKVSGSLRQYFSWGKNTLFYVASGGSSLDTELPFYERFMLGGWSGLSGYRYQELQGTSYALFRLGYDRHLGKLPTLLGQGGIYALLWGEAGNVWELDESRTLASLLYGGTLALGADTILGPFYIAISKAEQESPRMYFSIGRSF